MKSLGTWFPARFDNRCSEMMKRDRDQIRKQKLKFHSESKEVVAGESSVLALKRGSSHGSSARRDSL